MRAVPLETTGGHTDTRFWMTGSRPNGFKESWAWPNSHPGRRQAQESSESEYGTFSGLIGGERHHRLSVSAIFQDAYGVVEGVMVNAVCAFAGSVKHDGRDVRENLDVIRATGDR